MRILTKLLLAMVLLALSLEAKAPNAEMVIHNMIQAYGGEKNLSKQNYYEQVWHIETMMSDKNGTDNRMVHLPDLLRTELVYPDKTEIRSLVKGFGIKQYDQRKIQAEGPMLDAMKLQLMRVYTPLVLRDKADQITVTQDKDHYILTLAVESLKAEYFVSKTKFVIEKVVGTLSMGTQTMAFLTLYENYKLLDGVLLPHKEIKYAGDVNTAIMHLRETKFIAPPLKHR